MVYAMMSIGVLGFVVWSQMMALPLSDLWVINSTVGWNGLLFLFLFFVFSCCVKTRENKNTRLGNLLDTFCSLNANKNAQSAGNSIWGSSETIRGNTYDLFKKNFLYYLKKDFSKDNNWLSWFIGFLEGDGAILEHKGRCFFVVTQKDDTVLHEIHETLNIGKVKHFYDKDGNRKYSRYIVSENNGIFLLYLLLNGNLVLQSRVNQLNKWNIALNNASKFNYSLFYISDLPKLIENTKEPSLNDAWLSGFTDAEGCFSVKIANEKKLFYVSVLFILDQKNAQEVLDKIASLFSLKSKAKLRTGTAEKSKSNSNSIVNSNSNSQNFLRNSSIKICNNMFRLSLSCNDVKKTTTYNILNYFNSYKLKTTKKSSFHIWSEILDITLGKQPLSPENLSKIRKLRHNMNYFTIQNQSKGYANKS